MSHSRLSRDVWQEIISDTVYGNAIRENYQGVATKYLNRYNALFAASYRNAGALVKQLCQALLM